MNNIKITRPIFNPATTTVDTEIVLPCIPIPVGGGSGVPGLQGIQGIKGEVGVQGVQGSMGWGKTGPQGVKGLQGAVGRGFEISGYTSELNSLRSSKIGEIWAVGDKLYMQVGFENGEVNTWNKSWKLIGKFPAVGTEGEVGPQGVKGETGKSAYQLAVENGYSGTLEEYLLSLRGSKGIMGDRGLQGLQGLTGVQGTVGPQGVSGLPGKNFKISRIFKSISEMEQSLNSPSISLGDFVLIDSKIEGDIDNGKLYCRGELEWDFVYNFSNVHKVIGPRGLQGVQGIQGLQGTAGKAYEFPKFPNKSKAEEWILENMDTVAIPGTLVVIVGEGTVDLWAINSNYDLVRPNIT